MAPSIKKALSIAGMVLLVPVLLFEEWGWEPLARAVAQLARLPLWARLEQAIRKLPPRAAVALFLLPMLLLLPVKLCGLFLLGRGHAMSALGVLLAAKLVGTAVLARLFQLVQPALMQIPVFARWYPPWVIWKDDLLRRVRASAPWRSSAHAGLRLRRWWRQRRAP